jgi:outer membrane protein OmpA-like peptidoglycan-associated protein
MKRRIVALACAGLIGAVAAASAQTDEQIRRIQQWNPHVGEIQKPGEIQKAGEIQQPHGIQAIQVHEEKCEQRLMIGADALFAFDKATLGPDAEETLVAALPVIAKAAPHSAVIEGHTDAIGSDDYNQRLSERRAETVKDWLVAHQALPASTTTKGYGKRRPIAPNTLPDGSDDPAGRQKNRRVEVVLDTCRS